MADVTRAVAGVGRRPDRGDSLASYARGVVSNPACHRTANVAPGSEPGRASISGALGSLSGRVAVVFGTRPEAVKLAPLLARIDDAVIVHSGQHYSPALASDFSAALGLRAPDLQLTVGGTTRTAQIREIAITLADRFVADPPRVVVVQGDTNSTLGGALAARIAGVGVVHVEAGLRSDDRAMPEEHNRRVVDHLASLACAPTTIARDHLLAEGIANDRIVVTGNTVVDALQRLRPDGAATARLLGRYGVTANAYVLATFHRPENVDDLERFEALLAVLDRLGLPVLLPLHPRAVRLETTRPLDAVRVLEPLPYEEFLALFGSCAICVSDSGGVQEEASVLRRPVVVARRSTERPEVIGSFAHLAPEPDAVGAVARRLLRDVAGEHARIAGLDSPYGTGDAAARIVDAIDSRFPRAT